MADHGDVVCHPAFSGEVRPDAISIQLTWVVQEDEMANASEGDVIESGSGRHCKFWRVVFAAVAIVVAVGAGLFVGSNHPSRDAIVSHYARGATAERVAVMKMVQRELGNVLWDAGQHVDETAVLPREPPVQMHAISVRDLDDTRFCTEQVALYNHLAGEVSAAQLLGEALPKHLDAVMCSEYSPRAPFVAPLAEGFPGD